MNNKIYRALNEIKAEKELTDNTLQFIKQQTPYRKKYFPVRNLALAVISACLLILTAGFSYNIYFTPNAYVDVDVNPSIELTINRFGKVIHAYGYNDDGDNILTAVELKHKSYENALTVLIEAMEQGGYIADSGLLSVTVQSENKKNDLLLSIEKFINSTMKAYHSNMEQDIFSVDAETKTHAHDLNISPARYLAILELQAADPTVTIESCRNHTISELKQCIHEHAKRHHSDENTAAEDTNNDSSDEDSNDPQNDDCSQQNSTGHNGHGKGHE